MVSLPLSPLNKLNSIACHFKFIMDQSIKSTLKSETQVHKWISLENSKEQSYHNKQLHWRKTHGLKNRNIQNKILYGQSKLDDKNKASFFVFLFFRKLFKTSENKHWGRSRVKNKDDTRRGKKTQVLWIVIVRFFSL